jgi:hypothetical protein
VAHIVTWIEEEAGVEVMVCFPKLVALQKYVVSGVFFVFTHG